MLRGVPFRSGLRAVLGDPGVKNASVDGIRGHAAEPERLTATRRHGYLASSRKVLRYFSTTSAATLSKRCASGS